MVSHEEKLCLEESIHKVVKEDNAAPSAVIHIVFMMHEYGENVSKQIYDHKLFDDFIFAILTIMEQNAQNSPQFAGNAAYILGGLIDCESCRDKILSILKETTGCIHNLVEIMGTSDLESMTNATGTASLLVQTEEYREWVLGQPVADELIFMLGDYLLDEDVWVSSNCALTLARICISPDGRARLWRHRDCDRIVVGLIMSLRNDNEVRGMNAAYALGYLCDDEEGMKDISHRTQIYDMILGLIHMLNSVNDDYKKNAVFCLKKMSQWIEGQDRINEDPDINQIVHTLCNFLTCGVEDLGKMAAVTLRCLAERKEGYMIQKDFSSCKSICRHVLSQMSISPAYRQDVTDTLDALMIPKPNAPEAKVLDAHTIELNWNQVEAKSGCQVIYQLINENKIIYEGRGLTYTEKELEANTFYKYQVRAYTKDAEESFPSEFTTTNTNKAKTNPPQNLVYRRMDDTSVKITWSKPVKVIGSLKRYYVQESGCCIHYEPSDMYHIASNLQPDKEYQFEVCAVTQKGLGHKAYLTVRTAQEDYNAPSKPTLVVKRSDTIAVTWRPPRKPSHQVNKYEVLCNGERIYSGSDVRCNAEQLQPAFMYTFVVVAITAEGSTHSNPAIGSVDK